MNGTTALRRVAQGAAHDNRRTETEAMNTTLMILCLALILYVGACVRQWRRISRGDEGRHDSPRYPRAPK
jgi:hypothetical protein